MPYPRHWRGKPIVCWRGERQGERRGAEIFRHRRRSSWVRGCGGELLAARCVILLPRYGYVRTRPAAAAATSATTVPATTQAFARPVAGTCAWIQMVPHYMEVVVRCLKGSPKTDGGSLRPAGEYSAQEAHLLLCTRVLRRRGAAAARLEKIRDAQHSCCVSSSAQVPGDAKCTMPANNYGKWLAAR